MNLIFYYQSLVCSIIKKSKKGGDQIDLLNSIFARHSDESEHVLVTITNK